MTFSAHPGGQGPCLNTQSRDSSGSAVSRFREVYSYRAVPRSRTFRRWVFPSLPRFPRHRSAPRATWGGLRFGLADQQGAEAAIVQLMAIETAEGVLVEEQAAPGVEVIVGGITDSQFGPVVMFGLGGVFVELFHDVAFAPAPMTRDDAFKLMPRVTAYRLLTGYRGKPPCDLDSLADILVIISELMATGLLEEIDLNPVTVYSRGALILDAKMLVAQG